jgi:hypothetical protein
MSGSWLLATVARASASADAMDAMCEKGVKAIPAATEGKGDVRLPSP